MKVFISYHRADAKYRKKLETILKAHQMEKAMKRFEILHVNMLRNVKCYYV